MSQSLTSSKIYRTSPSLSYTQISSRYSYNLDILLGEGAYGKVYGGWDKQEGQAVAVKYISRGSHKRLTWRMNEEEKREELDEITILKRLSCKHPSMLRFLDSIGNRYTPEVFIITQLCEKGPLSKLITKLTERDTFILFLQLVQGMSFLNKQKISHRDLKPSNLLITAKNQLKIADFGTARDIVPNETWSYKCTPAYAAPQVLLKNRSDRYDQKCDVFSAGYVLYEMLTGERFNKHEKDLTRFFEVNRDNGFIIDHPAVTQRWAHIIGRMLQFNPANRPSFDQLKDILINYEAPLDKLPAFRPPSIIQEQSSKKYIQTIRKMLEVMHNRSNYLINIIRVFHRFQQQKSELIPKVYKIMLLYLSLSLYCKLSEDWLYQIDHRDDFKIDKMTVDEMEVELTRDDRAILGDFLKEMSGHINRGKEQMKQYIIRKVMVDIDDISRLLVDNPEKIVLEEFQIIEDVKRQRENREFGVINLYQTSLSKCVNNLYRTSEQLASASDTDLITYLMLLYVSKLIPYTNLVDFKTSTLPPRLNEVILMSREQLQKQISFQKNRR